MRSGQMSGGHSIESSMLHMEGEEGFRTRSGFKTGSVKRGFEPIRPSPITRYRGSHGGR